MISTLAVMAGVVVFGFSKSASAGLSILSQQVEVDRADQEVVFTVDFNHAPNFKTADSLGRRLDSFQYEIVPNTTTPIDQLPFTDVSTVIRGEEIGSGNVIPIRNGFQGAADPSQASGGWGSVRGVVPFTMTGDTLSFAAGFNVLGTANGTFSYRLFTTNYGSTVSVIDSASIPLPPALPAALATIGAFLGLGLLRRRFAKPR